MRNDVNYKVGVYTFKPSGRIAGHDSKAFRESIFQALLKNSHRPLKLLFDFHDVKMMDSTGLGALMEVYISVTRKGGRVGIVNVGAHINSLLVMSHLISHFEHFDSENEAILALRN